WYELLGKDLGDDPISRIQEFYRQFNLGARSRSPFWVACKKLRRLLASGEQVPGLVWGNLYPCDQRKDRPTGQIAQSLLDLRVLPREIEILRPDVVVFFTGPEYDDALNLLFPSSRFTKCGLPSNQWVHQVEHSSLPL